MTARFILLRGTTRVAILLAALAPVGALAQDQPAKPDHIVINDSGGAMQSAQDFLFGFRAA